MHWADRVTDARINQHPDLDDFHLASGTTPSGAVHCGNIRDILTNGFVARGLSCRVLRALSKTVRGQRPIFFGTWKFTHRARYFEALPLPQGVASLNDWILRGSEITVEAAHLQLYEIPKLINFA
jgi:hypothetical protein